MATTTFPTSPGMRLDLRISHGTVTVIAVDDAPEATVEVSGAGAARLTSTLKSSTLVVTMPRQGGIFDLPFLGRRDRDEVDVVVTVPTATPVRIATFTADVSVRGEVGDADVATATGPIAVERVRGDLRLRFGSGRAEIGVVTGTVQARSGQGSARFDEVGGALTSACGSGELVVGAAHGPVRSRAGTGTAELRAVHADVDLVTGSGSVTIGLPSGVPARLDIVTASGHVDSDLPVDDARTASGDPIGVRVRSGSGDVRLVRAA